jgi:hypothetical protein
MAGNRMLKNMWMALRGRQSSRGRNRPEQPEDLTTSKPSALLRREQEIGAVIPTLLGGNPVTDGEAIR